MRAAVEPGIEQRFDPFSQTWTEAAVWVRIDADEFARGSVRYCFRAKVQSADDATNAVYGKLRARLDALPGMTDDVVAAIASKIDAADSSPTVGDLLAALEADPEKAVHEAVFACLVDESARTALKEELAEIELHRPAMESRWTHPGCNRIAKCYIKEGLTVDEACRATEEDIVCQSVAKAWAEAYNRANAVPGSISGVSKAKTPKHPPKKVDFVALTLLRLTSRPDDGSKGESVYALEAVIEGDYRKYNNNAGMLVEDVHRQTPQALSHFVWEHSGGRVMLSDVQGVAEMLTDPVIHTASGQGFGETNLGIRGMALFFASHLHTPLLELLGMKPFGLAPVEVRRLPTLMREFQQRAWDKHATGSAPPEIAYAAGPGMQVTLEAAAAKAAGSWPLGFDDPGEDAARDLAAAKTAADRSLDAPALPGHRGRPQIDATEAAAAASAVSSTAGLATSFSAIGPAPSAQLGCAASIGGALGHAGPSGGRPGPRLLKRLNSATAMILARGALGPASHLLKTHKADTLAQSSVAGAGKVKVALVASSGSGDAKLVEEQEEEEEEEEAEEGEEQAEAGREAGSRAAAATSPASRAPGGEATDDEDDDEAVGAVQSRASASMDILQLALPGDAADAAAVHAGAASAVAAASETPRSPGSAGGPSFRMLFCATHFDLAICHATERLMHFPEVDSSAVGFHLATAAEGFVPAAYVAARISADETVAPFPDDCIPNSRILSFRWFLRAAMGGSRPAMVRAARLFRTGIPAPESDDPAMRLASWRGLGHFEHEENPLELEAEAEWVRSGVKEDGQLALQWLEAAIKTDPEIDAERAMFADPSWKLKAEAAELLAEGAAGLEAEPSRAAELYNEAAEAAMCLGKGKVGSKYMRLASMLEG